MTRSPHPLASVMVWVLTAACLNIPPPPAAEDGGADAPPSDAPPSDATTLTGIAMWWQLDDDPTDTVVTDSASGEHRGQCALPRCPALIAGVQGAGAYLFSADVILAADPASQALPFTVTLWVRPDNDVRSQWLMTKRDLAGVGDQWELWLDSNGSASFLIAQGGLANSGASTVPVATWTHLAASWDGATVRVFTGGVLRDSAPASIVPFSPDDLTLGSRVDDDDALISTFEGALDDVRVYHRALDEAALAAIIAEATGVGEP